jgi:hypothetical protein
MRKSTKILLAIATIWPLIYMVVFFVVMISTFSSMPLNRPPDAGSLDNFVTIILPLHLLTMLLVMGLTIFYIVNVFRNDRVIKDKKTLWAVVLFLGNVMVMPVYWYLYIWPSGKDSSATPGNRAALHGADASRWANDVTMNEAGREYVPPSQPPDWR